MTARQNDPTNEALDLLASIGVVIDWVPTTVRPKLERCPPGSAEADELALAMTFSNTRKMQLLFYLLAPILRRALDDRSLPDRSRSLARRIKAQNDEIDALGQDYGAIAERLEEIVRDQAAEIGDEYQELLDRAAGGTTGA